MSTSRNPVLVIDEWTPSQFKTLGPKINERGGKSIGIISNQTNRALQISTPPMICWGISDYIDKETGESDGKFTMSLQFPIEEYRKPSTDMFLEKLKEFENLIIDEAVAKSEVWFGEVLSREVLKHNLWSFLKYSKVKGTKKIDLSKPPSLKLKVPYYDTKWNLELYDADNSRIFPSDNGNLTPLDFVPSKSQVACVIQLSGINIVGNGWGPSFKITQGIVKPRQNVSILGKCHVFLTEDDRKAFKNGPAHAMDDDAMEDDETLAPAPAPAPAPAVSEAAPDTDDEEAPATTATKRLAPAPEATVVKRVVKKKVVAAAA